MIQCIIYYIYSNGFPIGEFAVKFIPWYSEFLLKLCYRQWKETCMKYALGLFNIIEKIGYVRCLAQQLTYPIFSIHTRNGMEYQKVKIQYYFGEVSTRISGNFISRWKLESLKPWLITRKLMSGGVWKKELQYLSFH